MNPFDHTNSVAFELSNVCPFAWYHKRCPISLEMASPWRVRKAEHLPAWVVEHVLTVLGEHEYEKEISFHQYNEPLADPRLFGFIHGARLLCPKAKIVLLTCGYGLSEQLVQEAADLGLSQVLVTLYGDADDREATERFIKDKVQRILPESNVLHFGDNGLDNRMDVYGQEKSNRVKPCRAPLATLTITRTADVALCCRDWRRSVTFGNLKEQPLTDLLPAMREAHRRLVKGDRSIFDVCQRCNEEVWP